MSSPTDSAFVARPVTLDYGLPQRSGRWGRMCTVLLLLAVMVSGVGTAMFLLGPDAESALVSGPALFGVAVILAVFAAMGQRWRSLILAGGHITVCCLFAALVRLLGWSPRDAQLPFGMLGVTWTLGAAVLSWLLIRPSRTSDGLRAR